MENFDELELLTRLKKGDKEAYLFLYDRYNLSIYNWAIKLVKIPQLAEDIVQEVFLKIWQIKERLNPQQSFPAFIYRICRNKAFTILKKIAADEKLRSKVMTQLAIYPENAENRVVWKQYEQLFNSAVQQLPSQRQKVFKLCRQQGKTYEEVAEELGISRNTVKEHMVMAVKNIKEYFYQYGDIVFILILFFFKN
jgi:RNA polymerase sigma-70 factor (family 1)